MTRVWAVVASQQRSSSGLISGLLKTMRPHQWVKNVFVLAPMIFAKELFASELILSAAGAFGVFCLLAGAVYTMNDLVDADADRVHPVKRRRPIASGQVSPRAAAAFAAALVGVALAGGAWLGLSFVAVSLVYFFQNVAYSFRLKNVPYVDVALIASGFVLRVVAGGLATRTDVSTYLFLCTALLALFLGFGKRRHELLMSEHGGKQREVLKAYSKAGLDVALVATAAATVAAYFAYTLDEHTVAFFKTGYLWPSTALVAAAEWRFIHLVRTRRDAESPTQEMLSDGPFVGIVFGWVMMVLWMVYNLQPA